MSNKAFVIWTTFVAILVQFSPMLAIAKSPCSQEDPYVKNNHIPPRLQWNGNSGYCGEVSLISAGLYYGQYISQYQARALAINPVPQNKGQLLLGKNDQTAAANMHLNAVEWDSSSEQSTEQFLVWVKKNVVKGYPVAIGVFTNEYLFYHNKDRNAGDQEYDHIVPVIGIGSEHSLTKSTYYGDDTILFSDNGLWTGSNAVPYFFNYTFDNFQANRVQANSRLGPIYSLNNNGTNYGIAITGVIDLDNDTYPVRVDTNVNEEKPPIKDGSNTKPSPMSIFLTITVSGLKPHVPYVLYRYNDITKVPHSQFNAQAGNAYESWSIQIPSGSTYVMMEMIGSDEIAVYRAVKASAK